jgi:glutathione S-transferase
MSGEPFLSATITLLAVMLYLFMGARVGILRGRHGIKAPATSGHSEFDRAYRVHLNTAEQYVAFLPLLWLATLTFHSIYWLPAAFGVAFLVARVIYMALYMRNPETRTIAAFLTMFSLLGLIVLSMIGLYDALYTAGY